MELRAHDLLRFQNHCCLVSNVPQPEWVSEAIARTPMVVVRRAPMVQNMVPVGVRGPNRNQRFAAYLPVRAIVEQITPEQLAAHAVWRNSPRVRHIQVIQALDVVDAFFAHHRMIWGPTGSVGFELASGTPTANATSDLDLIVRMPHPLSIEDARKLLDLQSQIPVRVDIQLETPMGAVSLVEYARGLKPVLLRTNTGPYLVNDPWSDVST